LQHLKQMVIVMLSSNLWLQLVDGFIIFSHNCALSLLCYRALKLIWENDLAISD